MRWSNKPEVVGSLEGCEAATILVGQEQREFNLHKNLLCETSSFFREQLEHLEHEQTPVQTAPGPSDDDDIMWLPAENADMFELFVLWLYQRRSFHSFLDAAIQKITPAQCRSLRFNLIRLHLFAVLIDLPALQDVAMDALQDMYLHLDWAMSPQFIAFIYGECQTEQAFRLRKWAVAMLAWTLHGGDTSVAQAGHFDRLFVAFPGLAEEYRKHLTKMVASKADVRFKNPQLRLPVNKLRNGERFFGFRQCSFHSHRATVGESTCPHLLATLSSPELRPAAIAKPQSDDVKFDVSDTEQLILTPVSDLQNISFLDLS
ncbi:hypothetical protein B0T24DRAFT_518233 [Lasiosphaeria ovina]|uniref:BTB domain-containing protein n=1 Tax=Lasiosphaeria ovina TaxID=92902 RepID=A0AAE0TXA0_9PEZI|nr:hypothetical protein B0T24DRAFT_518233 [Lasiosphaeria ovina]